MRNKAVIGISAAAMAAGLGFGVGQLASAEDEATPTPTATSSQGDGWGHAPGGVGERGWGNGPRTGMGVHMGLDIEALAEQLGVEEAALREAVEAAREAMFADGRPTGQTAEEREATREEHHAEFAAGIAAELGLDEADVLAALEEVAAARVAERAADDQAVLDEAVSDGTLTQAEADAVAKAIEEGIVHVRGGHGR